MCKYTNSVKNTGIHRNTPFCKTHHSDFYRKRSIFRNLSGRNRILIPGFSLLQKHQDNCQAAPCTSSYNRRSHISKIRSIPSSSSVSTYSIFSICSRAPWRPFSKFHDMSRKRLLITMQENRLPPSTQGIKQLCGNLTHLLMNFPTYTS